MEWAIKQDQYTVIEYTQCKAVAITHTLKKDDSELVTRTQDYLPQSPRPVGCLTLQRALNNVL